MSCDKAATRLLVTFNSATCASGPSLAMNFEVARIVSAKLSIDSPDDSQASFSCALSDDSTAATSERMFSVSVREYFATSLISSSKWKCSPTSSASVPDCANRMSVSTSCLIVSIFEVNFWAARADALETERTSMMPLTASATLRHFSWRSRCFSEFDESSQKIREELIKSISALPQVLNLNQKKTLFFGLHFTLFFRE